MLEFKPSLLTWDWNTWLELFWAWPTSQGYPRKQKVTIISIWYQSKKIEFFNLVKIFIEVHEFVKIYFHNFIKHTTNSCKFEDNYLKTSHFSFVQNTDCERHAAIYNLIIFYMIQPCVLIWSESKKEKTWRATGVVVGAGHRGGGGGGVCLYEKVKSSQKQYLSSRCQARIWKLLIRVGG